MSSQKFQNSLLGRRESLRSKQIFFIQNLLCSKKGTDPFLDRRNPSFITAFFFPLNCHTLPANPIFTNLKHQYTLFLFSISYSFLSLWRNKNSPTNRSAKSREIARTLFSKFKIGINQPEIPSILPCFPLLGSTLTTRFTLRSL